MKTKYEKIADNIKQEIHSGIYKDAEMLPPGKDLATKYETSLLTITKAINILVLEGLLLRKKGAGTFIRKDLNHSDKGFHLTGTTNKFGQDNVKSHTLTFSVITANDKISSILNIKPKSFVYEIIRVREINGVKNTIEYTYMPIELVPGLSQEHLDTSIYDYIQNELKINIKSSNMIIKSAMPTQLELDNLEFKTEKFLIETEQIVYTDTFQILEYSIARKVHDDYIFETTYLR